MEGAEERVLRGARELLGRRSSVILLEAHPWVLEQFGDTEQSLLDRFAAAGWTSRELYRRGREGEVDATVHYVCEPKAWALASGVRRSRGTPQTSA